MLKRIISVFILFSLFYVNAYNIVFVHIGKKLPSHLPLAIMQARKFNDQCPIYLLANDEALKGFSNADNVTVVPIETLARSALHNEFLKISPLNRTEMNGFWLYTSERFFILEEFVQQYDLQDIIHLESDVMIYVDFNDIMPVFKEHCRGIGLILENDIICVPCLMYIKDYKILQSLTQCFIKHQCLPSPEMLSMGYRMNTDMLVMGYFFKENQETGLASTLPIIMSEYGRTYELKNLNGRTTQHPEIFSHLLDKFNSIFDGAALGQYWGGTSPDYGKAGPGWIDTECLFSAAHLKLFWQIDSKNRRVPFAEFKGKTYKINNLHIHSKKLVEFKRRKEGEQY